MQHYIILKTLNIDLLTHRVRGVCRQKNCYNIATFRDSNKSDKFDMQHDHVLNRLIFDLLAPSPGCKIFATMLLHS